MKANIKSIDAVSTGSVKSFNVVKGLDARHLNTSFRVEFIGEGEKVLKVVNVDTTTIYKWFNNTITQGELHALAEARLADQSFNDAVATLQEYAPRF